MPSKAIIRVKIVQVIDNAAICSWCINGLPPYEVVIDLARIPKKDLWLIKEGNHFENRMHLGAMFEFSRESLIDDVDSCFTPLELNNTDKQDFLTIEMPDGA